MLAFNSVDSENIPENGEVTYNHPETGLSITTILRNCSLQDELDNVSLGIYGKCLFWIICPTTYLGALSKREFQFTIKNHNFVL